MGMWLGSRYTAWLLLLMSFGFVGTAFLVALFFFFLTQWYLELHQSASLTEAFYLFFSEIVKIHRSVSIFCLDHSDLLSYLIQNS